MWEHKTGSTSLISPSQLTHFWKNHHYSSGKFGDKSRCGTSNTSNDWKRKEKGKKEEYFIKKTSDACFESFKRLPCVCVMCTRLSLSDYMALGLMYGEHIFYINEQQTLKTKNKMNININIIP